MSDDASGARPLPVLRALIDAVDREVLQLLARRLALAAEVAEHKVAPGAQVRDPAREAAVLEDRLRRAEALGLPAHAVESIWRSLLVASRERQAELRASRSPRDEPRTVAIIGGLGGMGRCLARLFEGLGQAVLVADLATELTPRAAAAAADVVVVSVPIEATDAVIREVGPAVQPEGLLMDVTSVKAEPLRAMLESTSASVLGTHPMFGPSIRSFEGQRVVLCPGRGEVWHGWLRGLLEARGLLVTESTAERHDEAMAAVQVLNHLHTQAMGLTLARLGVPLEESLAFTSPAYLMELYVAGRHFAQSPELYAEIEMRNPLTPRVTGAFEAAARELSEALTSGDRGRFAEIFREVAAYFGPFAAEALRESGHLVDRLVERA